MIVHLFNPENDLALAAGTERFTPPKAAVAMRNEGALLPLWWAGEDDAVVVNGPINSDYLDAARRAGLHTPVLRKLPFTADAIASPWGWSMHARRILIDGGMDINSLPSEAQLARHRELSHRRTSLKLLKAIGEKNALLPVEATTPEVAFDAIKRFDGDAYIKLPWSGSGRGVFHTTHLSPETLGNYVRGFIKRQGSVMVEKARKRIKDFAMLFEADDKGVHYSGLSSFATDSRGAYYGNLIASQSYILSTIGSDPRYLAVTIEHALAGIIGNDYRGWIGVDMMTEERNGSVEIVPCVEVNLRMTMGVAAMLIRRCLPDHSEPMLLSVGKEPLSKLFEKRIKSV